MTTPALIEAARAISALREWVQAVPQETPLPAMPGIDGDWLDGVEIQLRAAITEAEKQEPLKQSAINFLPHDVNLRFVQRVLESNAPQKDRDDAAQMIRDIRRSIYTAPKELL